MRTDARRAVPVASRSRPNTKKQQQKNKRFATEMHNSHPIHSWMFVTEMELRINWYQGEV